MSSSIRSILSNSTLNVAAIQCRAASIKASKLIYSEYGDPCKVIEKCDDTIKSLQPKEVLIKMLAAPVNPADINTIQGKYPSRPVLPAVPGNEGVGEIIDVGSAVTVLNVGDRVVPLTNLLGTWRTHLTLDGAHVLKVPKELGLVEASTLTVNPCTAYRMLKDFVDLKPDDVIIQNGANSACGQNVIQLARIFGLRSVNIIRNRPNVGGLKHYLESIGATLVFTEEELRKTDIFKTKILARPKLALNCVGGASALEVMRHLDEGAPIVTYGGMSREPLTVGTAALIFRDIHVRGFWMTAWAKKHAGTDKRKAMFDDIIDLMLTRKLTGPATELVAFDNYKEALMNTLTIEGMIGKKFILNFEKKKK